MNVKPTWYVITGASFGIGYEIALQLCKLPGVNVLALARTESRLAKLKEIAGDQMNYLVFDLEKGNLSTVYDKLLALGAQELKGIAHSAGNLINKPYTEIQKYDLEKLYAVNVFAPFLLTQQLLPLLKKSINAHVLMLSSMGGVQGTVKFQGLSGYSSSKGALSILTECMALELSDMQIQVNCLALGAVQTEMLAEAFPGYKAPTNASEMGEFISWFLLNGNRFFNGKILPVALSTP